MDIFEKLMLARQLKFTDGEIDMLGQRVVIVPSDLFTKYMADINDKPDRIAEVYNSAKQAMKENFGVNIGKSYGFNFNDFSNWFVELATLSGWGNVKFEENDKERHVAVITIKNSPIAVGLKGKVSSPCDHIIRGLMAGGSSSAYKNNVDMIETDCEALGAEKCKFIIDTKDNLRAKFPDLVEKQLGK